MTVIDAIIATLWMAFGAAFLVSYIFMCSYFIGDVWGGVAALSPMLFFVFCLFYYGGAQ